MGENRFATAPTIAYGAILFMCALACSLLARCLTRNHPRNAVLSRAIGKDRKGWLSIAFSLTGIALSWYAAWLGFLTYVAVATM